MFEINSGGETGIPVFIANEVVKAPFAVRFSKSILIWSAVTPLGSSRLVESIQTQLESEHSVPP